MKLCTVKVQYITSITKLLEYLNSPCSNVCSHCSIVCLITKNGLKNDRILKFFVGNEIHMANSPFNEDCKNIIFSRETLISGEERPENLGKMGNNRDICCYSNRGGGVVNVERQY